MNEELTNDLIAVIWPYLDEAKDREGAKGDVMDAVHNVLDSWTPKSGGSDE